MKTTIPGIRAAVPPPSLTPGSRSDTGLRATPGDTPLGARTATRVIRNTSILWRLLVWTGPDNGLHRHWCDVDLALEWGRRYLEARTVYEQNFCFRRWYEAANLGAYAMRHAGIDSTTAELREFATSDGEGGWGLDFPPFELLNNAPTRLERRPGWPVKSEWIIDYDGPAARKRLLFDYGAIVSAEPVGETRRARYSEPQRQLVCAILSNRHQGNNVDLEYRIAAFMRDVGREGDAEGRWVGEVKAATAGGAWHKIPAGSLCPGVTLAIRWRPVVLDGWWEVLWLDENEERLRASASFGDMKRAIYADLPRHPEHISNPDVLPQYLTGAPLGINPDRDHKAAEVARFISDPVAFLTAYRDAILDRNAANLKAVDPSLVRFAEGSSELRSVAVGISELSVKTLNKGRREDLQRAIEDVLVYINMIPVIGQVVDLCLRLFVTVWNALGGSDLRPEDQAMLMQKLLAAYMISGQIGKGGPEGAIPPDHSVTIPWGWRRPATERAVSAETLARATRRSSRTLAPDPTLRDLPESALPELYAERDEQDIFEPLWDMTNLSQPPPSSGGGVGAAGVAGAAVVALLAFLWRAKRR